MAASLDFIYLGYGAGAADNDKTGYIYRCPLTSGGVCVQFGDAGNRPILSLVLANGRLYAGLGRDGIASFKEGLIWNCDPTVANSCYDFKNPGKTDVNALAVGVGAPGYLWAGLANGIIWRCSLDEANSCLNWYETEKPVVSISFDDEDGTTFDKW